MNNAGKEKAMEIIKHDDITVNTDRFVKLSDVGGSPMLELRPATLPEHEFDGETIPAEDVVEITLPGGTVGVYRREGIDAALEAVEHLRAE